VRAHHRDFCDPPLLYLVIVRCLRSQNSALRAALVQRSILAGAEELFEQQHVDVGLLAPEHH